MLEEFDPALLREICMTLFVLGVPAHVNGYAFLIDAIALVYQDPTYLRAVTSRLYPEIAQHNNTTPLRVERSIRNAIEIAFRRADIDTLKEYFGNTISQEKGKATNSEFIATAARRIGISKAASGK